MNIQIANKSSIAKFVSRENTLLEHRLRNIMILGAAAVPFLLPFSINNFIQGRYIIGALTLALATIALINSYTIRKRHSVFIPDLFLYIVIHLTLFYAILKLGEIALFWCYPVFFVVFFISERMIARINILFAYVVIVSYSFYSFDFSSMIRFATTLFMLCYFSDLLIGVFARLQKQMMELAIRDPLTNAFNRRHMNSCILDAIEETKRGFGPACLVLLDIDHFKPINDNYGHEAGDQVLKKFVDILQKRQRKIDYVFRAGGEEFVVLLRNTSLEQAVKLAENLRKYIAEIEILEKQVITISLGVAEYQSDETDDEWLKRADDNMYEAKNLGRNRVYPLISDLS
jgi:diguanylate cyclase